MAKKSLFKNFFSKMKRNAEKEKKEKMKQDKTCGITYHSCRHYGIGCWGYGSVLAMMISYLEGSSLFWTLIHGLLSWFYIIWKLFHGMKFF